MNSLAFLYIEKSTNLDISHRVHSYMQTSPGTSHKKESDQVEAEIQSYLDKAEKIRSEHPDLYEALAKDNKKLIK